MLGLQVGTVISVLEAKKNDGGILRIRFDGGCEISIQI